MSDVTPGPYWIIKTASGKYDVVGRYGKLIVTYPVDQGGMAEAHLKRLSKRFTAREKCMRVEAPAMFDALRGLAEAVDGLIDHSGGVYGLHLNGDQAPWSSLTQGGQFEEWLLNLEGARAILSRIEGEA